MSQKDCSGFYDKNSLYEGEEKSQVHFGVTVVQVREVVAPWISVQVPTCFAWEGLPGSSLYVTFWEEQQV